MRAMMDAKKEVCFHIDDINQYEKIKEWFQQSGDWVFRAQNDAPWGNEIDFEKAKRNENEKPAEAKFSLSDQPAPDHSTIGILRHINNYAQSWTTILRFYLDVDIAMRKMLGEQECKECVIWAIRNDRLIAKMREMYIGDSSKSDKEICFNHAIHICSTIGRHVSGVFGVVPLSLSELGIDECLLIPCKGENFAKNLNVALSCDVSKLDSDEYINVNDSFDLSSCVIVKMTIPVTLFAKLRTDWMAL